MSIAFDNHNVKYEIILGTNFLTKEGIKLNYSDGKMEWFDCSILLYSPVSLNSPDFDATEVMFFIHMKDNHLGKDW